MKSTRLHTLLLLSTGFLPLLGNAEQSASAASKSHQGEFRAITQFLEREVADGKIAGAVALVTVAGEERYGEAIGYANLDSGSPMRRDALFRIASMTKAITSAAAMQLVESGDLALDEPVSTYLPEFKTMVWQSDPDKPAQKTRPPTIRELLTHTSGIVYGWFGPKVQEKLYAEASVNDVFTPTTDLLRDRVETIAALPLAFPPGEQWSYGLGIDVMGRIVEVVSGKTLDAYFESEILSELGMKDTWFSVHPNEQDRLASLYSVQGDTKRLFEVRADPVTAGPITFSGDSFLDGNDTLFDGGSGLVSTIDDYHRFLEALLTHDDGLLNSDSYQEMMKNQIGDKSIPPMNHGDGFGFGFGVLTEKGKGDDIASVGTVSWGGIFNTYYWIDPEEELIGILMTQIFPFDHLDTRAEFKRLVYESISEKARKAEKR